MCDLAEREQWRLALVGDPRQLQAVGRGGLFNELCATSRVHELARLHRFHQPWEAQASLQLRAGDPSGLDAYEDHGRIVAGGFGEHLDQIAKEWLGLTATGKTVAITAATNDHVDALNDAVQRLRLIVGQLDPGQATPIAAGEHAYPGDLVATRHNDRELRTTTGEPVRNRDLWTVAGAGRDGSLTVSHLGGHGTVTLPSDYVRDHVRLGYAATEHGNQADTVDVGIQLVSPATTCRGLYVGATRGREENRIHVVTESADLAEARDVLEAVLAYDRADVPAVTQRRHLANQTDRPEPSREPDQVVPAWLVGYRDQLEQRREDLTVYLTERAHRRAEAAAELADLQPALAAARGSVGHRSPTASPRSTASCGGCFAQRCGRPTTMPRAPASATGTRPAERQSGPERVEAATERIAAIHADGDEVKQHLDTLASRAEQLQDIASGTFSRSLDDLDRLQINCIDQVVDAIDTWSRWACGHPVALTGLAAAVETLTEVAAAALHVNGVGNAVGQSTWFDLLEPAALVLRDRGLEAGLIYVRSAAEVGLEL